MKQYRTFRDFNYYNNARILVAGQVKELEEFISIDKGLQNYKSITYPVVVINTSGIILFSNMEGYLVGDAVNINEFLQTDKSLYATYNNTVKMSFALLRGGTSVGFAAFFLPREEAVGFQTGQVMAIVYLPIIVSILFTILLLLLYRMYMRGRILKPVREMIISSKAIIDGNLDVAVIRTNSSHLLDDDINKLTYHFEIMRDELKDKRRREEELKRGQKELISCISHDLKTPISTIKAYSEGLRDGLAKEPDKIARYANIIVNKTEILTKMISDLLEFTNSELDQLSIAKKEQYFKEYIDKLAGELEEVAGHNGISFCYEYKAPNLLVIFDESRITQVINNLFDNSMKYGGKKETCINLSITYKDAESAIHITVEDNGNGIGEIDKPFVFDKFYRGEKSRSMRIPGSGLGLSICRYIVLQHGGCIKCESKVNRGTSFTFTLPV